MTAHFSAMSKAKRTLRVPKPASYRVNVRFDREAKEKLALLELQMAKSTSDVLRDAVALLFEQKGAPARTPAVLGALVGKFKGPSDLARNYKTYLTESLGAKHGGK